MLHSYTDFLCYSVLEIFRVIIIIINYSDCWKVPRVSQNFAIASEWNEHQSGLLLYYS